MAAAAAFGPFISWHAPGQDDWEPIFAGVDLDSDALDLGEADLDDAVFEGELGGHWHGAALDRAARAYAREAGWDFAPDETGVWLMMLAPVRAIGGNDGPWHYTGHLTGFVILHDRDGDGDYEAVAHIWTATAWRRRGIARRLLAEARTRFTITEVEQPYTDDGAAFLDATPALDMTQR